ncbi:MAG: RnfABCDGE type electron transport complex subunit B [Clostridiales bacterium]
MYEIGISALILGILGALFGLGLSIASKVFKVEVDKRVEKIREVLPGANCGACGFAGCDAFAEGIVFKNAPVTGCPVGGEVLADNIAKIMGVSAGCIDKTTARVMCNGRCSVANEKYIYHGMDDCFAAAQLFKGHKSCTYGCLGHGNCVKACPFDAIAIVGGVARVIEEHCKSCGKCIEACPKNLIEIVPAAKEHSVLCSSKDKGGVTRKNCEVGCIGCMKCVKTCPVKAISMDGSLAKIDYDKCTNCGKCTTVCPTMAIRRMDFVHKLGAADEK